MKREIIYKITIDDKDIDTANTDINNFQLSVLKIYKNVLLTKILETFNNTFLTPSDLYESEIFMKDTEGADYCLPSL